MAAVYEVIFGYAIHFSFLIPNSQKVLNMFLGMPYVLK